MDKKINKILKDLELCNVFFDFIIEPNESKNLVDYIKQLQQQNKQLKEIINEAIKKVDILRRNYAENICPIPCAEIEDIDRTLKEVSDRFDLKKVEDKE